jgi:DUF4097 and DUF4098 domain-containing protein YvlB
MKRTAFFLLLLAAALGLRSLAATEDSVKTNLTAMPGGKLVVDVDFGALEIATHASKEILIDIQRKVSMRTAEREAAFLKDNPIAITQDGSTLSIRSRKSGKISWNWSFGSQSTQARYLVTVPVEFAANLSTRGGPISVRGLHGNLKADTSGGGLRFEETEGDLNGSTSGGAIQIKNSKGTLRVETSGGGIRSEGGAGSLHADTSGGAIEVKSFGGPVRLHTSGGGIRLESIAGEVFGETSGGSIHAQLPAPVPGAVHLSTSGGGIEVVTTSDAAFDLDASTSAGGVSCDLPITTSGAKHRSQLKGPVNGGGPKVVLETSAGSVRVRSSGAALR